MLVRHHIIDYLDYNDRLAYIVCIGITLTFFTVEMHEIFEYENVYGAFENVNKKIFSNCSYTDSPFNRGSVNWYLICLGNLSFDNTRLMPLLISTTILPITFLLIRKYSANLTAILVQSALALDLTFLIFDSVPAFGQTWALFFLASIYFLRKKPILSGIFFWIACLAKILTLAWLPVIFWIILKGNNKLKNSIVVFSIIPIFLISIFFFNGWTFYSGFPFVIDLGYEKLESSYNWFVTAFRWEWHLLFGLPILFGYYYINKLKHRLISFTPYLTAICGVATIFLVAFFTKEGYYPYRMVPNIIMMLYAYGYSIRHFLSTINY